MPDPFLKTGRSELLKQYLVYDVDGRVTDVYEAPAEAEDGAPCLRTRYSYDGTSGRIEKRLEVASSWDSSWDFA